jgi:hypothetical protein
MTRDEAVAVLTRTLRHAPTATLRRMAESPTPTIAAVARALLEIRGDADPLPRTIFPS